MPEMTRGDKPGRTGLSGSRPGPVADDLATHAGRIARIPEIQTPDLKNSGDTAGVRREVVGYGAWAATG